MSNPSETRAVSANPGRRRVLAGAAAGLALAAGGLRHARAARKIRVGYWPIAAGLPF